MIISWRRDPSKKPIETEKAYGFKIKHDDTEKVMWIPKSLIKNGIGPDVCMSDIPDWFYDKKVEELFLS
jgi:hypothetical protein